MESATPAATVIDPKRRFLCRHIFADGHRCGSPSLRGEPFCYYHHTTRRPKPAPGKYRYLDANEPFDLPIVEDRASALLVASQLLSRIASNDLDLNRAGRLIAGLRVAVACLPREPRPAAATQSSAPAPVLVEDPVLDETHGPIAPAAELPTDSADNQRAPTPDSEFTDDERSYFLFTVPRGEEHWFPSRPPFSDAFIRAEVNARRQVRGLPPVQLTLKPKPQPSNPTTAPAIANETSSSERTTDPGAPSKPSLGGNDTADLPIVPDLSDATHLPINICTPQSCASQPTSSRVCASS